MDRAARREADAERRAAEAEKRRQEATRAELAQEKLGTYVSVALPGLARTLERMESERPKRSRPPKNDVA